MLTALIFPKLLLAHLLGDFVFQSNDLIMKKYKSWTGTFEHVLIITFFTALLLFPYWAHLETWAAVGTVFLVHFLQDLIKVKLDLKYNQKRKSTLPFFIDQLLHILLIVYLSSRFEVLQMASMPYWLEALYTSTALVVYLTGLVLFSYVYDITLFQFLRKKSLSPLSFEPDFYGMQKRMLLFSVIFILVLMSDGGFM